MNLGRAIPPNPFDFLPPVPELHVTSTDVSDGERLASAQRGGNSGGNVSPALAWESGPDGTASYAVGCFDPDAPTPGGVWHWLVVDIPADVRELPPGVDGGQGRSVLNDLGTTRYEGAAPPPGDREHRYIYTVFALGVDHLDVEVKTPAPLTGFHLTVNSVARGSVTGLA